MAGAFDPAFRLVVLDARLIGPQGAYDLQMVLDTGAMRTAVRPLALRECGYDLSRPVEYQNMRSATGIARTPFLRVARLACAGVHRDGLLVAAHQFAAGFEFDGLLGLDFLRPGPLRIDFARGTVRPGPRRWWPFGR